MQTLPALVPEQLYTTEEVSEYLRLSLRTVQRLVQQQAFPAYKLHGQYRIKGLDLLNYLDNARQDAHKPLQADKSPLQLTELLKVSPVALAFGKAWLPLIHPDHQDPHHPLPAGEDLYSRLQAFRKQMVLELGFIMPGVQLSDSADLPDHHYRILLHGVPLLEQALDPGMRYLAAEGGPVELKSIYRRQAAECYQAVAADAADSAPAGSLSALDLLYRQLRQVIAGHAHEILSREEVAVILEQLREQRGVVLDEVMGPEPQPHKLTIGQLTQILRQLLQEQVSIRNLGLILELLANALPQTQAVPELVEKVRQGLSRQINQQLQTRYQHPEHLLEVLTLSPEAENELQSLLNTSDMPQLSRWFEKLRQGLSPFQGKGILICAGPLRRRIFEHLQRQCPELSVISYYEISEDYRIKAVGQVI